MAGEFFFLYYFFSFIQQKLCVFFSLSMLSLLFSHFFCFLVFLIVTRISWTSFYSLLFVHFSAFFYFWLWLYEFHEILLLCLWIHNFFPFHITSQIILIVLYQKLMFIVVFGMIISYCVQSMKIYLFLFIPYF